MTPRKITVADGVDVKVEVAALMDTVPVQAIVLAAISKGHSTYSSIAVATGRSVNAVQQVIYKLRDAGVIVCGWDVAVDVDDIPTVCPTGKTVPTRGGSSTRTKGRK